MPFRRPSALVAAAALCVVACAFFAGANALAKAAQTALPGPELHPIQVAAARFLFALLVISPWILRRGRAALRTDIPLRHLQRVMLGFGGVSCIFAAAAAMPLADAIAIVWSAPLFTLAFAAWFLKERVGTARCLAAAVGFAGVVVLAQPSGAAFEAAALLALLAAVFTGAEVATVRILAMRDSALTVLAINNLLGTAIACAAAAFVFVTPSWEQALALAGVGAAMVSGQAILLKALARAEASAIAPYYYATIAWSALIGVLAFDETPGWRLMAGAGLIALGGVAAALAVPRRPVGACGQAG